MNSIANGTKHIEGLEKALKVEVNAGDKKKDFNLVPAFRDQGHYNVPFYPTIRTTYQYRLFGTINNTSISLSLYAFLVLLLLENKKQTNLQLKFLMVLKENVFKVDSVILNLDLILHFLNHI
ncbi:MAG: hypothetical protein M3Z01_07490 [Thermoproteota archaeon]|nr:hypothetical protein [Thermoproteota archaeon]